MESVLPFLTQASEIRDKYLTPILGIFQTAKGYMHDRRSERNLEQSNEPIALDDLAGRETTKPGRGIDQSCTSNGDEHRDRVQKLMQNRDLVLASTYPSQLPSRPKTSTPRNRWKIGFFGLLLIFIAAVTPLAVLAARQTKRPGTFGTDPARDQSLPTITQTVTQTETATRWNTSITTRVTASLITVTHVTLRTSTYTESNIAKSTGIGKDCNNNNVFLAKKYCIMVTECNQSKLDVEANDCREFCNVQPKCKKENEGSLSEQLHFCCGHCGCFD